MLNQFIIFILFYNALFINNLVVSYSYNDEYRDNLMNSRYNLLQAVKRIITRSEPKGEVAEVDVDQKAFNAALEHWTGRWMPNSDPEPTPPSAYNPQDNVGLHHGMPMKFIDPKCDDGKTNLTIDWNGSPVDYTCYKNKIIPNFAIMPVLYCEYVPRYYRAQHLCMKDRIEYDDDIPVYGTHRPVWPVYGEYKYLPRQRWLHSLEHGAVVMLYHPCANPLELKTLKNLVKNCLRRHIITASNLLDEERPFALVTWGCRLTMSYVNPKLVKNFIRTKALRGAETTPRDGIFAEGLLKKSDVVSDEDDTNLCQML